MHYTENRVEGSGLGSGSIMVLWYPKVLRNPDGMISNTGAPLSMKLIWRCYIELNCTSMVSPNTKIA